MRPSVRSQEHRRALGALLAQARVEHVGSTAVPGSVTKGDLHICVIVEPAEFARADALLADRCPRNLGSVHTTDFAAFTGEMGHLVGNADKRPAFASSLCPRLNHGTALSGSRP